MLARSYCAPVKIYEEVCLKACYIQAENCNEGL